MEEINFCTLYWQKSKILVSSSPVRVVTTILSHTPKGVYKCYKFSRDYLLNNLLNGQIRVFRLAVFLLAWPCRSTHTVYKIRCVTWCTFWPQNRPRSLLWYLSSRRGVHLNRSKIWSNIKGDLLGLKWVGKTTRQLTTPKESPRLVADCLVSVY